MLLYVVDAHYTDFEVSWSKRIGIFDDVKVAIDLQEKWTSFYKQHINLIDKPEEWVGKEEWEYSDEYFHLLHEYQEIQQFNCIEITKEEINLEVFNNDSFSHRNESVKNLIIQWERNYRINKIINEK